MLYGVLFFIAPNIFSTSFGFFKKILIKVLPIFIFIFVLMVVVNRYINNNFIIKHIRGNKIVSWFYIIMGGILSTGPLYMWYPLLKDLRDKGISNGEIACFLYNRSIKPAYFPLIILYFGLKYVTILTFVMIVISIVQAIIIDRFIPFRKQTFTSIK